MSMAMTEMREPNAPKAPARDEQGWWEAVRRRDPAFDGKIVFAVRTTGVDCRPSCASRPAKRDVVFFSTLAEAEKAGYRAGKRCRPDKTTAPDPQIEAVRRACERIDEAEEAPKLAELAANVGLSPHHFHRVFKAGNGRDPEGVRSRERRAARRRSRGAVGQSPKRSMTRSSALRAASTRRRRRGSA